MKKKKVIFTVTNDVFADQRINKMARTLSGMGFDVVLVGVKRKNSPPFNPVYADVLRIPVLWQKGFMFYASYNIQLFFFLLFRKFDILVANDLDTLLPGHLVARLHRKPLVYDTHEYFTGTPEVISRPKVYKVWKWLENKLFPRQQTIITVNRSIAGLYEKEYNKQLYVVRNVPPYHEARSKKTRHELGIPENKRIIIMQGTGINTGRGAEELIAAMQPTYGLENTLLLMIGGGNAIELIKRQAQDLGIMDRVLFLPRMPWTDLFEYTIHADIGLSLDRDHGLNYRFSLPNKLFDYIMAGTPVLVSDLPEVSNIVDTYNVGRKIESHDPSHIAGCIKEMLHDQQQLDRWKENCLQAAKELCWEQEEERPRWPVCIFVRAKERFW